MSSCSFGLSEAERARVHCSTEDGPHWVRRIGTSATAIAPAHTSGLPTLPYWAGSWVPRVANTPPDTVSASPAARHRVRSRLRRFAVWDQTLCWRHKESTTAG
jgi:hypothetical protein